MSTHRANPSHGVRLRRAALFQIESLERRLLLSSAIAAFGVQQTFATGPNPRSVVVADVNSDGKPDLIVANSTSNTVSVLLGNGNGTYQSQQTLTAGSNPFSVAVADVNRDGKLDLFVANNGSNNISLLLGNGNGTFQAQKTFSAGANSRFVAISDVNSDGKPDAVVANYGAGTVSVLLGNGDGTFQNQQIFSAGTKPSSIAVADFNVDGKPDLAVANKGVNNVSILLGNGNGTFQLQFTVATGTAPFSIAAGDLNQDGKLDLAIANESNNNISVLIGNGNGTFQPQSTFATGTIPCAVAISDVNGDGKPDLAVANYTASNVGVLLGNGDGSFQVQATFATGSSPFSIALADVNNDTRQDLLVANESSNSVTELLGNELPVVVSINRSNPVTSETSADTLTYAVTFNQSVYGVAASDFRVLTGGSVAGSGSVGVSGTGSTYGVTVNGVHGNGTVQLELVDNDAITNASGTPLGGTGSYNGSFTGQGYTVFQAFPSVLSINRASPPGPSTNATSVSYSVTFSEPVTGVNSSDFSLALDGVTASTPVAVTGSGAAYTVTVNGISGNGTLGLNVVDNGSIRDSSGNPLQTIGSIASFNGQQTFATGALPSVVTVADLNGDGKPDAVTANDAYYTVSVFLGNGDGSFQPQQTYATGKRPTRVIPADVNGDGKLDLIVANQNSGSIGLLLGNGNGTFLPQQTLSTGTYGFDVAVADVNGDGKPDLIFSNYNTGGTISVMLGNGNGTFQPRSTFAAGNFAFALAVTDVNGDGRPDVVVTDGYGSVLSVLLGNGDGTFGVPQTFATGRRPWSVAASDVNGDGKPDLLVANYTDSTISVLLGNGNGSFQAQKTLATASNPRSLVVADVNGDGRPDVLTANSGTRLAPNNTLNIFLGAGDGTFPTRQALSVGQGPYSAAVADLNADGRPDVLVANADVNNLGILLNNSSGSFTGQTYTINSVAPVVTAINRLSPPGPITGASSVTYSVTFSESVFGVAASDFRLVTTGSVVVTTPLNLSGSGSSYIVNVGGIHGSGTLQLNLVDDDSVHDSNNTPLGGTGLFNGSFDGQCYMVLQTFPTVLSINRANPSRPQTSGSTVSYAVTFSEAVAGVDASDFSLSLSGVTVTSPLTVGGSGSVYTVTVSGISGTGSLGLKLVDNGSIRDLSGNPLLGAAPSFQATQTYAVGSYPDSLVSADINGDGKTDLAIANYHSNTVGVLLGNGDGTFQSQVTFAVGSSPSSLAVADVNGDGSADLIVTNFGSNSVSVLVGNGNGTFEAQQTIGVGSEPNAVVVSDINGDGKPDLLIANRGGNTASVLLGNGNGTYQAQQTYACGSYPQALAAADLNGDGKPDLIVANYGAADVSLLLSNGNGTFQNQQTFAIGSNPLSLAASDLNGDGRTDLIVSNGLVNAGAVSVLLGNGNGTFQPRQTVATGTQPATFALPDLNGDGRLDLAVSDELSDNAGVLLGNGDGSFQAPQTFATGSRPFAISAADVNGDGRLDLITTNHLSASVGVSLSNSNGNFAGQLYYIGPTNPGAPDLSFGKLGQTVHQFFGPGNDVARAESLQSDGKLVVVGATSSTVPGTYIALARYNPDGSLDGSFGNGGTETLQFNSSDQALAVAIQSDGKIVVAGQTTITVSGLSNQEFSVVRINSNGTLDTTFGGTGQETISIGTFDSAKAVAVQSDGKIVVAGSTNAGAGGYAMVRLNPDGGLDSSFGVGGKVTPSASSGNGSANALTIDSVGRIVVVGSNSLTASGYQHFNVSRYTAAGSLDTSFGTNGSVITTISTQDVANAVALQTDGSIVVAGSSYTGSAYYFAVARYTTAGALDSTFGSGGEKLIGDGVHFDTCTSVGITQSGGIELAGLYASADLMLVKLTSSGTLDTTFNGSGQVIGFAGLGLGAVLRSNGAISAIGSYNPNTGTGNDFAVGQYTSSGQADTTFGGTGFVTTNFNIPIYSGANAVAVQSDRKIVVAGNTNSAGGTQILIARYNADGSPDATFGNNGAETVSIGAKTNIAYAVEVDPSGNIVVGGEAADPSGKFNDLTVARYLPNGAPDTTFGSNGVSLINPIGGGTAYASALAFGPGGSVVVAGTVTNNGVFVASLSSSGQLTSDSLLSDDDTANALAIDASGRAVVAGYSSQQSIVVMRFTPSLSLDSTFGTGGVVTTVFTSSSLANGLAVQPDGKIVVGGNVQDSDGTTDFGLLRYNSDGTLDATFGSGGKVQTNVGSSDSIASVRVLSDGSILAAGSSGGEIALADYSPGGSLVPAFGSSGIALANFGGAGAFCNAMTVRPDGGIVVAGRSGFNLMVGQILGFTPDVVLGTPGSDSLALKRDADGQHLDWTMGTSVGQIPLTDPNGLTLNGNGGSDLINLDYTNGNPVPATLHLNGTFTVNGLSATNPLSNTTLEIGRSTVYISYSSSDPLALIQEYLRSGYNTGGWNGTPTASTGVITSTPAAQNAAQSTAIGYTDSADGLIPGQPANTIELKYALYGDTGLTGSVGFNDFTRLTQHYNQTTGGTWDTGDFNYDGLVNFNDFTLMTRTYNTSLGSEASPAASGAAATSAAAPAVTSPTVTTSTQTPVAQTKPAASAAHHHKPVTKHAKRHRR